MTAATTRPVSEDSGGSCDWGGCDGEAVAERYATDLAMWLPVCRGHVPCPNHPMTALRLLAILGALIAGLLAAAAIVGLVTR